MRAAVRSQRALRSCVLEPPLKPDDRRRIVADRLPQAVVEAAGLRRAQKALRPQRRRRQDRPRQRRRVAEDRLDVVVRRQEISHLERSPAPGKPTNESRPVTTPRPCVMNSCSRSGISRSTPPPSGSVPRMPNSDELELTRYTFGFGQLSGHPVPVCLPLTTSMSRLMRPYSVMFASCA